VRQDLDEMYQLDAEACAILITISVLVGIIIGRTCCAPSSRKRKTE